MRFFPGFRKFLLVLLLVSQIAWGALRCPYDVFAPPPPWAYDSGHDRTSPLGQEIINLQASLPFAPEHSTQLTGGQKFRPDFGQLIERVTPWFGVKLWFMGQDPTHMAEAGGRPATAAFGGYAQSFAAHFGVNVSAAFWNAYQYTIKGQYGSFDTPYVYFNNGKPEIRVDSFVDNQLWTLTHEGALPEWRKRYVEYMLQNHPEMKAWILFGSAARDSTATFINGLEGGYVGPKHSKQEMKNIQMPETKLVSAGGNNVFPVLLGQKGQDLYSEYVGRKLDYSKAADKKAADDALKADPDWFLKRMVYSQGGPYGNGLLDPAQLGGYNMNSMRINGKPTISLKGAKLSNGYEIPDNILVAPFPHPSSLARDPAPVRAKKFAAALKKWIPFMKDEGFHIEPDPGGVNHHEAGEPYVFDKLKISSAYYDFGAPKSRQASESTASRMKGMPWGIIWGTRNRAQFRARDLDGGRKSGHSDPLDAAEAFTNPPRGPETRFQFDPGPGVEWAKLMKSNLPAEEAIFAPKPGMSFDKDGIAALDVKTHQDHGDFGHYRGTFKDPKVFVLSDPQGYNDLSTSRAQTGARGQYLHGLMKDVGVGDQYLVVNTVPYGMDGASRTEWGRVLDKTKTYREKIIEKVLKDGNPSVILADGPNAKAELERILGKDDPRIVLMQRGESMDYGVKAAGTKVAEKLGATDAKISGEMKDIPRSHLPERTRYWLGRGGDQTFTSYDRDKGLAMGIVVPEYASKQAVELDPATQQVVDGQIQNLRDQNMRLPGESIPDFIARRSKEGDPIELGMPTPPETPARRGTP